MAPERGHYVQRHQAGRAGQSVERVGSRVRRDLRLRDPRGGRHPGVDGRSRVVRDPGPALPRQPELRRRLRERRSWRLRSAPGRLLDGVQSTRLGDMERALEPAATRPEATASPAGTGTSTASSAAGGSSTSSSTRRRASSSSSPRPRGRSTSAWSVRTQSPRASPAVSCRTGSVTEMPRSRPRQDLNLRHLPPEGSALSAELRSQILSLSRDKLECHVRVTKRHRRDLNPRPAR